MADPVNDFDDPSFIKKLTIEPESFEPQPPNIEELERMEDRWHVVCRARGSAHAIRKDHMRLLSAYRDLLEENTRLQNLNTELQKALTLSQIK